MRCRCRPPKSRGPGADSEAGWPSGAASTRVFVMKGAAAGGEDITCGASFQRPASSTSDEPGGRKEAVVVVVVWDCVTTMANMRILTVALLGLLSSSSVLNSVDAQKTSMLFAFGDSYADVGNTPKSGPNKSKAWTYPYGITWPGQVPAGRFSDGKIQTDWIAELVGLSVYPPPYYLSSSNDTSKGMNFAVGGAGVTPALNPIPLGMQVGNFELFLRTDPYSKTALANSLTLVSVVGNDYLAFTGTTSAELFVFVERVVSGIQANLQRLYDLGLRNVMVANMFQADCGPIYTRKNGYTKCTGDLGPFVQVHNAFLLGAVQSINAQNPGARFIILDQYAAFDRLIKNGRSSGFTDGLKPCCRGTSNTTACGDVDQTGKWLYTVCKKRGRAIFWDNLHPTMWAWHYIVDLYANKPGYILLADAPTLKQWMNINDAVQEPVAAPMAQPDMSTAVGEVQAALNYLLDKSNYSEALGLVQSFNYEAVLGSYPKQVVTLFLPNNGALSAGSSRPFIDRVFAQNKVNEVAAYHLVSGYYDLNAIVTSKPASVMAVTGKQVPLSYPADGVYVGPNMQAKVVDPNLYSVPGQVVIHGIDHVLMPPGV